MKINMRNKKILAILVMVFIASCDKEIECQTCDNGYPISNIFKNECESPWIPISNINPCDTCELNKVYP